jgi:hypothetical protein
MIRDEFYAALGISATALSQVFDNLVNLLAVYWARGYSGVTDDELLAHGITRTQLTGMITLAEQVSLFRSGQATAQVNHNATLNQMRRDI